MHNTTYADTTGDVKLVIDGDKLVVNMYVGDYECSLVVLTKKIFQKMLKEWGSTEVLNDVSTANSTERKMPEGEFNFILDKVMNRLCDNPGPCEICRNRNNGHCSRQYGLDDIISEIRYQGECYYHGGPKE
jgi:hypothetical protein